MSIVMGIDPGLKSGIAVMDTADHALWLDVVATGHPHDFHGIINKALELSVEFVVCEAFTSHGTLSGYGLHTLHLIGAIQAYCRDYNLPLTMQMPGQRVGYLKKAKERTFTLTGKSEHVADALAHVWTWKQNNHRYNP
jgi:hypothetical protein